MSPEELASVRRILAFGCLIFTAINFAALLPEIIRFVHLLMARYRHKKHYIKKVLANNPPPRATFFGRTNGKYIMIEGPYEDQYLPAWKRRLWRRNKSKRLQIPDKNNKMDLHRYINEHIQQKANNRSK